MSGSPAPGGPYGSAYDLPSVRETLGQLRLMRIATHVVMRDKHEEIVELERQARHTVDQVDLFYERFGSRHWIFHDHLPWSKVEALLAEQGLTDDEAEQRLIELQAEHIEGDYWWLRLRNIEGLRERYHLLERAREHYIAGQFDSCALQLVTVIDGFVNDFETDPRRGIHARDPEEMQVWDGFAGHHQGLTAVMNVFLTTFKKRVDNEVVEVYRHGIAHGTVVNYNNRIVATKAWNLLGAVVDWAAGKAKQEKASEPKPTLTDLTSQLRDRAAYKQYEEEFEPSMHLLTDEDVEGFDVVARARAFCEAWHNEQWGLLPQYGPARQFKNMRTGEAAKKARRTFRLYPLVQYELTEVRFPRASVAEVIGTATIGDVHLRQVNGRVVLRWHLHRDETSYPLPGKGSEWRLSQWAPEVYIKEGAA